jgi:hypothetical protein
VQQEEFKIKNQRFLTSVLTSLSVFSFLLCVLALTRQYPFFPLSKIISLSLIFIFIFSIPVIFVNFWKSQKYLKFLFMLNILFLTALLIYSIVIEKNNLSLAIRFFTILVLMLAVFFLPAKKEYVKIFIVFSVIHSVVLILFEIYILLIGGPDFAEYIRGKVMNMGMGDIYTYNQYFYRIQIKGNPVLPIAFLVSLFAIQTKPIKISVASLLFVGTIVAGNLAFILAIVFFFCTYWIVLFFLNQKVAAFLKNTFNSRKRIIMLIGLFLVILLSATIVLFPYLKEVLVRKMEYSIPARFDQVSHLIDDLMESPITLLFGQGLGNIINVISDYRDYRNAYYFELQTIYVLNQVGVLYFSLFLITKIIFIIKFWRNKLLYLLYLSYILYAFTNPYLFDTTNILVLIVLSSLGKLYLKEGNNSESKI